MSNSPIRILVGMPAGQTLPIYTTKSLMEWQHIRKYPSLFEFKIDTYIDKARNELVWSAVKEKATHLMMIDSDMVFPPMGIDHLVEQQKDIIGGLYYGRLIAKPQAFHVNPDGTVRDVEPNREKGIFEVDFIGTGFMLINMNVFKKMDPPFFKISYEPEEFGINKGNQNNISPALGEDVYFCLKARKLGFKVWCDTTIDLGHIGSYTYTKKDYDAIK